MHTGIEQITARVREEGRFIADLQAGMGKVIVGQRYLIDRLLVCLLANGHVLLEGVPGLAKTLCADARGAAGRLLPAHPVHPRPAAG